MNTHFVVGIDSLGKQFLYAQGDLKQCELGVERYKRIFEKDAVLVTKKEAIKILKKSKQTLHIE